MNSSDAVSEINAFLKSRRGARGLDPDFIHASNNNFLTIGALDSLLAELARLREQLAAYEVNAANLVTVRAQRDELVAALSGVMAVIEGEVPSLMEHFNADFMRAHNAIAQAGAA